MSLLDGLRRARRLPAPLRVRIALLVAGSAFAALVVMYALVVPSLERNLESSRVNRLAKTVLTSRYTPQYLGEVATSITPTVPLSQLQSVLGVQRIVVYQIEGTNLTPFAETEQVRHSPRAPGVAYDALRRGRTVSESEVLAGRQEALVAYPFGGSYVAVFAEPLGDVHGSVQLVQRRILIGGALALGLAVLLGLGAAESLARRLRRLREGAERIARGRFDQPVIDEAGDEIGDLARSFDAMRLQLERLDRTRNAFIANASHELRTPLTTLAGFLELVREEELDAPTRDEFLEMMREQLDRLTRLASDLLDLSRLDAGGVRVAREQVDLSAIAADCVREAGVLAARRSSVVRLAPAGGPVRALGDDARLHQIARSLVDNALRHTPEGTTVTVAAAEQDGAAVLTVSDDGPGIPADAQAHVFDRFFRGRGAAAQGSGLGLAIARELAERMGGTLTLRSRPGETVFSVALRPARGRARVEAPVA